MAVDVDAARRAGSVGALYARNARSVVARGLLATRSTNWPVMLSGFFEPVFYLFAMGVGLGTYIGDVELPSGQTVTYAAYIAPALLAVSAMNGAVYDSTNNVFFKMHYGKLYDAMLTTSLGPLDVALGEILTALLRGGAYAAGFLTVMQVMGLNLALSAVFAVPAVLLVAFGFASVGMAVTSYLKTFQHLEWVTFVMLPMFLFSATFYPVTVYPGWLQGIIKALPLYQAVELVRGLTLGVLDSQLLGHVAYFVVMIALGLTFTTRRLRTLFLG
ncbi:ABC transporter permease [Cellulomonas sp. URHD0024]|uniref:ABC transporter permease n=1 Tax=Cellulomonas sp. URHD0024 TaxID=1302620 RepID=UPI00042A2BEE|nr:ABC transporter permease [Cellulomonas sp. URHD0024]